MDQKTKIALEAKTAQGYKVIADDVVYNVLTYNEAFNLYNESRSCILYRVTTVGNILLKNK